MGSKKLDVSFGLHENQEVNIGLFCKGGKQFDSPLNLKTIIEVSTA